MQCFSDDKVCIGKYLVGFCSFGFVRGFTKAAFCSVLQKGKPGNNQNK